MRFRTMEDAYKFQESKDLSLAVLPYETVNGHSVVSEIYKNAPFECRIVAYLSPNEPIPINFEEIKADPDLKDNPL